MYSTLTLAGLLCAPALVFSAEAAKETSPATEVLAVVAGVSISEADVEARAGAQLQRLRDQIFEMRSGALEALIADELMRKEAANNGLSVAEFKRVEIDAKVPAVTEADKKAAYEQYKSRMRGKSEEEGLKMVEAHLRRQRISARHSEVARELRRRHEVVVHLDPPRVEVAVDDDPAMGPADAPVTIVEFSDFQCPYCARVKPTLDRLTERYGKVVRIVFRDFPLAMHKNAAKAAEAAQCAHEQGKFWPMHDRLFANQAALGADGLRQSAEAIGLEAKSFGECLESGRYAKEWAKDMADGQRYGVTGTPAFFVNGRRMSGAVPFDKLAQVVEDELQRKGVAVPPAPLAPEAKVLEEPAAGSS